MNMTSDSYFPESPAARKSERRSGIAIGAALAALLTVLVSVIVFSGSPVPAQSRGQAIEAQSAGGPALDPLQTKPLGAEVTFGGVKPLPSGSSQIPEWTSASVRSVNPPALELSGVAITPDGRIFVVDDETSEIFCLESGSLSWNAVPILTDGALDGLDLEGITWVDSAASGDRFVITWEQDDLGETTDIEGSGATRITIDGLGAFDAEHFDLSPIDVGFGSESGVTGGATGVAYRPYENRFWVMQQGVVGPDNGGVLYEMDLETSPPISGGTMLDLTNAQGVAVDPVPPASIATVYVVSRSAETVYATDGFGLLSDFQTMLPNAEGLAFTADGTFLIAVGEGNPFMAIPQVEIFRRVGSSGPLPTGNCSFSAPTAELDIAVLLEGPHDPGLSLPTVGMGQGAFDKSLVPLTDPYLGTVTVSSLPSTAVDWVLVELYDVNLPASSSPVLQVPAIVHSDGSITDAIGGLIPIDGLTPWQLQVGDFSLRISHRTHASASTDHWLSPAPISLAPGQVNMFDLTTPSSPGECMNPSFKLVSVANGEVCVLYAGDTSSAAEPIGDNTIDGGDKALWLVNNGLFGVYDSADFTLDGDVNGADKAIWLANNGIATG